MSTTAIAWLFFYLRNATKGLWRPSFLVCAYLMTFYTGPNWWWWGREGIFASVGRWNFYTAILLATGVVLSASQAKRLQKSDLFFILLLLAYVLNCTLVHFLLADYPAISFVEWDILWKNVLTAVLFRLAIRDLEDLHWVIGTSVACCCYVGYEIVFNGAGKSIHGRLEGLGFPGGVASNGCATVMSMMFPFLAYLVICKPFKYARVLGLVSAPLILDSILRFNSRGSFLGMAVAGCTLLLMARGKSRLYAIYSVIIGIMAFFYQAQDPKIWERLFSIGSTAEERDESASQRIDSWSAGLQMIRDYPLGSGGRSCFISPRGDEYISFLGYNEYRSVHNGFISIAAGWGVQGFLLITIAFGIAMMRTWSSIGYFQRRGDEKLAFLGAAIIGAFFGQCTCAMFGDYYDGEWFFWLAIYGLVYATFEQSQRQLDYEQALLDEEEGQWMDSEELDSFEDTQVQEREEVFR